jgi:uncharacterized protein YhbP (UPF0306 family)
VNEPLRRQILEFLNAHHVLSLATCSADGPWAAALFYVCDADLNLYFLSDPATRHCRDIERDARVAVTVNLNHADWTEIRGLQIGARAAAVAAGEREAIEQHYLERFPDIRALVTEPRVPQAQAIAQRFTASRFYRIAPQRIRLIDNTRGFGYREELQL